MSVTCGSGFLPFLLLLFLPVAVERHAVHEPAQPAVGLALLVTLQVAQHVAHVDLARGRLALGLAGPAQFRVETDLFQQRGGHGGVVRDGFEHPRLETVHQLARTPRNAARVRALTVSRNASSLIAANRLILWTRE